MKLAYGIFYTKNLPRIEKFYTEVLGFPKEFGDKKFAAFKIGDALLGIKIQELKREVPGHQTIIVAVEDVSGWYSTLKDKNVVMFSTLTKAKWGTIFRFSIQMKIELSSSHDFACATSGVAHVVQNITYVVRMCCKIWAKDR